MELGGGDDFCQLFHIGRLDINNIEALILNVEVPQIDPEIVTAYERLAIAVDGYAVDVIGVGIGICSTRHGSNDGVVVSHAGQLQLRGVLELWRPWGSATRYASRSDFIAQVVLCHDFQRLFEDLP